MKVEQIPRFSATELQLGVDLNLKLEYFYKFRIISHIIHHTGQPVRHIEDILNGTPVRHYLVEHLRTLESDGLITFSRSEQWPTQIALTTYGAAASSKIEAAADQRNLFRVSAPIIGNVLYQSYRPLILAGKIDSFVYPMDANAVRFIDVSHLCYALPDIPENRTVTGGLLPAIKTLPTNTPAILNRPHQPQNIEKPSTRTILATGKPADILGLLVDKKDSRSLWLRARIVAAKDQKRLPQHLIMSIVEHLNDLATEEALARLSAQTQAPRYVFKSY